jgi:hypothetical protein
MSNIWRNCPSNRLRENIGIFFQYTPDSYSYLIENQFYEFINSYSDVGSGTLAFSGSATTSYVGAGLSYTGSGTILFSGNSTNNLTISDIGSGTLTFSGSATKSELIAYVGSGNLTFSGNSTNSL